MKYASEIIGLPVIAFDTGEKFETVNDLIYDEENNQVVALLTDTAGLFAQAKVIPFDDVQSVGDDAIIVPTATVEVGADTHPAIAAIIESSISVKNKTVMTEDGKDLGKISDLQLDEITGRVLNYKTSGGIFADMYKGTALVPAPDTIKVGESVVFVPNSTVQLMESQVGGLKGAAQAVGEKTSDFTDQAKEKGQELTQTAGEKFGEAKDKATSPEAQSKLGEAKEGAANLWDQAKEKAGELKDQASAKVEENKIKGALGRPVTRVILNRDDSIILNTGDLITNESIEKARAAGVLDVLLASVYDHEPDLTNEDLKA